MESIRKKEREILSVLGFKLTGVTPYEFLQMTLRKLDLPSCIDPKLGDYFEKLANHLLKMAMYDYDLVCGPTYGELAASAVWLGLSVMEQLDKKFPLAEKVLFSSCVLWN